MKKIFIPCLILGVTFMLNASFTHVKAMLGQWLIVKAWADSTHSATSVKPWPWLDSWPVAQLRVPRLHINQIVLAGDNGQSLAFGPGLRLGSAMPGEPGTTLVSGHRDTHFRFLQNLTLGDEIEIENSAGEQFSYRVEQFAVVGEQTQLTMPLQGSVLLLATCWPFDSPAATNKRFLVMASQQLKTKREVQ